MKRIVFELSEFGLAGQPPQVLIALREPAAFASPSGVFAVTPGSSPITALDGGPGSVDPSAGDDGPQVTRDAGEFLCGEVLRNEAVADALDAVIRSGAQDCPIYVQLNANGVEPLPWEAMAVAPDRYPGLTPPAGFLGLDPRWPVGRMVFEPPNSPDPHEFSAPLRIAAVISCLDVPGLGEWEALKAALTEPGAVPVELRLFVSENTLLDAVVEDAVPGVTVALVPGTVPALQRAILAGGWSPQVLHFFCHGSAADGGHLRVARLLDWSQPDEMRIESLILEEADIRLCAAATEPAWLLVMNCCESAVRGDGIRSLALRLTGNGKFAAVVGLRDLVTRQDANRFTEETYRRLSAELVQRLSGAIPAGDPVNWPAILVDARKQIARQERVVGLTPVTLPLSRAAATRRAWTLPTVYVAAAEFRIVVDTQRHGGGPGGRSQRLARQIRRDLRQSLPPDAPVDLDRQLAGVAPSAPHEPPVFDGPVLLDAFDGHGALSSPMVGDRSGWTATGLDLSDKNLRPSSGSLADFLDQDVGWAVVLPWRDGLTDAQLATADDAPVPIQQLVAHRNGKVLRYRSRARRGDWLLRDHSVPADLLIASSPPGRGPKQLPMYLMIAATPQEIPWRVQFALNTVRFVGRLDLTGRQLANYVAAAIDDWSDSRARYDAPVVWAVDTGSANSTTDITSVMRSVIAAPVAAAFAGDDEMAAATYLDGSVEPALLAGLIDALAGSTPALVVTTSHGMTGPTDDLDRLRANLGLLVDQDHAVLDPAALLAGWNPDGAIWFAQACCSAGSNQPSGYAGLFPPEWSVRGTLEAIAEAGAMTAPLPRALLGAEKPLRAFIGRVEPTFDWTLRFPASGQALTADLVDALYGGLDDRGLCNGKPVGLALNTFFDPIGALLLQYDQALTDYGVTPGHAGSVALDMALYLKVTANDRAGTVILGDPAVAMALPVTPTPPRP